MTLAAELVLDGDKKLLAAAAMGVVAGEAIAGGRFMDDGALGAGGVVMAGDTEISGRGPEKMVMFRFVSQVAGCTVCGRRMGHAFGKIGPDAIVTGCAEVERSGAQE